MRVVQIVPHEAVDEHSLALVVFTQRCSGQLLVKEPDGQVG